MSPVVPLESILREPLKNGYSARRSVASQRRGVLTLTATTSGYFDSAPFQYTDEEDSRRFPALASPDDVLIQRGNTAEFVRMPALYDGAPGEFIYPDLMIRARFADDINPDTSGTCCSLRSHDVPEEPGDRYGRQHAKY